MPIASILAVAVGLLALAGCGSSASTTSTSASTPAATTTATTSSTAAAKTSTPAVATGTATAVSLEANPEGQLKFNTSSLTAKAGKVTIAFTNTSPLEHNFTVASSSGAVLGATPTFKGGTKTLALDLKSGTYKFYCAVPGHRMAGMEGTLTVK